MDHFDYIRCYLENFICLKGVNACLKLFQTLRLATVQCSNILSYKWMYPQARPLATVLLRVYDLSTPALPQSVMISHYLRACNCIVHFKYNFSKKACHL